MRKGLCHICGEVFSVTGKRGQIPFACSHACRREHLRRNRPERKAYKFSERECELCREPFMGRGRQRGCSPYCTRRLSTLGRYRIEPAEYREMLAAHDGFCGACSRPFIDYPHIDHNHETGKVRGLLCQNCNIAIGQAHESLERLEQLGSYLARHQLDLRELCVQ